VLNSSGNSSYLAYNSSTYFKIGGGGGVDTRISDFDDIGIWNRALTQQEITDLYNGCTNPTATITPQGNTTFCQGGSVVLNASTGTGYTYEWYKDGSIISGATAISYSATQSGNYTVKVINGACNATSAATTVTVNPNPTATITPQGNTTFCQGASVILNASTGANYMYEWYKDGNLISGSITSSYTANQSGSYTVKVINGACNATSGATTVTVNPNPTATITPQGNTTFCQGASVVLNASTGIGYTYEWYKDGNLISSSITSSYTAVQSGSFTVKVINGACNATSGATTVTVNPNPTATITPQGNTTFCQGASVILNASTGANYMYEWYKDGNLISGSLTSSYTANQSGSYTVKVINGACNATSIVNSVSVLNCAGLDESEISKIKFYPNPTKEILFIDNGNYKAMSGYSIKIVSLTGAVVYNQPITSQQVQISMNQFGAKGVYIAQIVDTNDAILDSKKIVLE
jgi:hypothetical protein